MVKKIYIGVSDFAKIVQGGGLIADKTLFIRDIIEDPSDAVLITRPRRWGKTLSQSMLHYFFSNNKNDVDTMSLFDGLAIAKIDDGKYIEEYQGKYPVILISFKDIKESTFDKTIEKLSLLIQQLFMDHRYLLSSKELDSFDKKIIENYLAGVITQSTIEIALQFLSKWLHAHYKQKVYILIDEYDTPLNEAYLKGYINELTNLMKNMMSGQIRITHGIAIFYQKT